MADVEQQGEHYVLPPDSEALHRLIIEAAKYNGAAVGETIPASEVVEQGVAEGYSRDKVYSMLDESNISASGPVEVPPQGDVFGDLWPRLPGESDHRTARGALRTDSHSDSDSDSGATPALRKFREWLGEKRAARCRERYGGYQFRTEHAYAPATVQKRVARIYDVGEYFCRNYSTYTTVLVTYRADRSPNEAVADHAEQFYPAELSRARWGVVKRNCGADEWAGVRLLAPSLPGERTAPDPQTHGHTILWIPGHHSRSDFTRLRDVFVSNVDGATREQNPLSETIQVQRHYVNQSVDVNRVTKIAYEAMSNLPLLRARNELRKRGVNAVQYVAADASDCPDYVEYWLASIWDGDVRRYHPLGDFTDIADAQRERP